MAEPLRVRQIMAEEACAYGVTMDDIRSRKRGSPIRNARDMVMLRCRNEIIIKGKPVSYPLIGAWFGRDHSAVMASCNRARGLPDRPYRAKLLIAA